MELGKAVGVLASVSKMPSPGPSPIFSQLHICLALLTIGDASPLGRIELSRKLGVGEGATRTIIKRLSQARLIETGKAGCALTNRGRPIYNVLRGKLSEIKVVKAGQLALDKMSVAVLVRGGARHVRGGIEQRDAAIRAGATGACTLVVVKGKYLMPTAGRKEAINSDDVLVHDLERLFNPMDGDAVIIVSAPDRRSSEQGAVAGALQLLR